ncbi:hypothetical protein Tco_0716592, partial [Tanacetum coccineum]
MVRSRSNPKGVFGSLFSSIVATNIQGVRGALDGAVIISGPYAELDGVVSPPDELVNISGPSGELDGALTLLDGRGNCESDMAIGPYAELDGVVSPPDELVNISGPGGELDGAPALPDGRDTTKTMETNLVLDTLECLADNLRKLGSLRLIE